MADSRCLPVNVGTHGDYEWLTTEHSFDDLLRLCPEIVLGKYIAISSFDSGCYFPSDEEKAAGWEKPNDIAYSPKVQDALALPRDGWDEWYVFENRVDLGDMSNRHKNPFEIGVVEGHVYPFVNSDGYGIHDPRNKAVADLFWEQFDWIYPESYISDGASYLTVVTANKELFASVFQTLSELRVDVDGESESQIPV